MFSVNCGNHSSTQRGIFKNHCAREKACFYFDWLNNERGIDESGSTLVSEFDYLRLEHKGGDTEPFNLQGEAIKSGTQIRQKKVRVLLTEEEIRSITHLVFYIELSIQWRKQNVGFSTQSLASETSIDIEKSKW